MVTALAEDAAISALTTSAKLDTGHRRYSRSIIELTPALRFRLYWSKRPATHPRDYQRSVAPINAG